MPFRLDTLAALRHIGPHPALQVAPHVGQITDNDTHLAGGPVATGYPLTYHGGPTLPTARLALCFVGSFWGDRPALIRCAGDFLTLGALAPLSQCVSPQAPQGCTGGELAGVFDLPALPAGTYSDDELVQFLQEQIAAGKCPAADGQLIHSLILPAGVVANLGGQTSCGGSNLGFCGYHSSRPNGLLYTIQPNCQCQGCSLVSADDSARAVLFHEVVETVSDPFGTGYFNDQTGMENADEGAWHKTDGTSGLQPWGPYLLQPFADLDGNLVIGPYNKPQPQPQPSPADQFYAWWGPAGDWTAQHKSADELAVMIQEGQLWLPYLSGQQGAKP